MSGAFVIQHAKRMRRDILSAVPSPSLPYFSAFSHKGYVFGGGGGEVIEHEMCVLIFSITFV